MLCEVCGERPADRSAVHVNRDGVAERSVCDICFGQSLEPIENVQRRPGDMHFRLFLTDPEMADGVLKRVRVIRHRSCPDCEDQDEVERIGCARCDGCGMLPQAVVLTIRVPAEVRSGVVLRIQGRGDYVSETEERGDIFLHVAPVGSRVVVSSSE